MEVRSRSFIPSARSPAAPLRKVLSALVPAGALAMVAYVFLTRGSQLAAALVAVSPVVLAGAVAAHLLTLVLRTEAWRTVLGAAAGKRLSSRAVHAANAGAFLAGTVQGQAAMPPRVALLRRFGGAGRAGGLQDRARRRADRPLRGLRLGGPGGDRFDRGGGDPRLGAMGAARRGPRDPGRAAGPLRPLPPSWYRRRTGRPGRAGRAATDWLDRHRLHRDGVSARADRDRRLGLQNDPARVSWCWSRWARSVFSRSGSAPARRRWWRRSGRRTWSPRPRPARWSAPRPCSRW